MPDYTPRPADLSRISLRELLDGYQGHVAVLVNARHGIGAPEPAGRLRADALDALACGGALADHLLAMRWVNAADALRFGASVAQVATALGLDVVEVQAGLRSWADRQHVNGLMSAEAHREVCALVAERNGG